MKRAALRLADKKRYLPAGMVWNKNGYSQSSYVVI